MSRHAVKDKNMVQELSQMLVFSTCSQHLKKKYWTPHVCKVAWGSRGDQNECYIIGTLTSARKSGKTQRGEHESNVVQENQNIKRDFENGRAAQEMMTWFLFSKKIANQYRISFGQRKSGNGAVISKAPWTKTFRVTWQGWQTFKKTHVKWHKCGFILFLTMRFLKASTSSFPISNFI